MTNSNKKIVITSVLLGAVILAMLWLAFFWEVKRIKTVSEDYQKEKLNSYVIQEKKDKFAKLNKEIANLTENTDELSAMFLKKDQALPLLKSLEDIASRSSCEISINPADISKIKFTTGANQQNNTTSAEDDTTVQNDQPASASTAKKPVDELAALKNYPAFTVQTTGSYSATVDFLRNMENLPYFIRPLTFDIVPADKNKQASSGTGSVIPANINSVGGQQNNQQEENKNITMTLNVVIYGN